MRLLFDNLWDDYSIYDKSSEDGNFPAENTQNIHTDTRWHTTGCAAENITIDMGSAQAITCVAISGHNLTNAATIKFQMDDHFADFGAPDLDQTLTWRSDHIIGFFASSSKQFARFTFVDAANPDGYISIGRLFIGTYLQVTPSSNLEFPITNERNDIVVETDTGSVYGTPGISLRRFQYNFPETNQSMITSLRTVYDTVGKYHPLYLLNYDTTWTNIAPAYVRIVSDLTENRKGNHILYNLEFKEVI